MVSDMVADRFPGWKVIQGAYPHHLDFTDQVMGRVLQQSLLHCCHGNGHIRRDGLRGSLAAVTIHAGGTIHCRHVGRPFQGFDGRSGGLHHCGHLSLQWQANSGSQNTIQQYIRILDESR